ncbi:MAG: ABC-F family ATP-binding cassette domain-containing protein [Myxococcota bacterium]
MNAPVLTAQGLQKAFGDRRIVDDADLAVGAKERLGLVGDNGAGKSTLARMIAGIEPMDGGEIALRKGARVGYLGQRADLPAGSTAEALVLEGLAEWRVSVDAHEAASLAIAEGKGDLEALIAAQSEAAADVERLGGWDRMSEVRAMLDNLGLRDPQRDVGTMSGGERRRVDLARLLVSAPDLAILDEPTNHLDVDTIEWLERYFINVFTGALLLVTHDRYVLDRVVQRTLELSRGTLFSYEGGWSAYLGAKAERMAQAEREERNRQNFLRTELEWLRRSPSARRTKQKARKERAEAALAKEKPVGERQAKLELESDRLGNTVLELLDVKVVQDGRTLVDGFELRMRAGERVGIVGRSGCGKTSLLRVILGEDPPAAGEVRIGTRTRFAYFDQTRSGLDEDATIQDAVAGGATRVDFRGKTIDIRSYLARFLFDGGALRQKVRTLSGGERARVALAKLLLKPANVLVFDEPTNDLDVSTLSTLEGLLGDEVTAVVVSHDRYFLDRVATSIVAFEGDGRVVRYVGNYDDYRRLRPPPAAKALKNKSPKKKAPKPAPAAGLTRAEERELKKLEGAVEAVEGRIAELDAALGDPTLYTERANEVDALLAKKEAEEQKLESHMARWEELEEKREGA